MSHHNNPAVVTITSVTGDLLSLDSSLEAEADAFNDATFGSTEGLTLSSFEPWINQELPRPSTDHSRQRDLRRPSDPRINDRQSHRSFERPAFDGHHNRGNNRHIDQGHRDLFTKPRSPATPPTQSSPPTVLPFDPTSAFLSKATAAVSPQPPQSDVGARTIPPFREVSAVSCRTRDAAPVPFTAAHRRRVLAAETAPISGVSAARSVAFGSGSTDSTNSGRHPGLMTARDKETIMKIHLTQISASSARAVQDWRGTFKFRSAGSVPGAAATGSVAADGAGIAVPGGAAGGRLYASVHHPRRNVEVPIATNEAADSSGNNGRLPTLLRAERVLSLLQEVSAVDAFIGTLHPLAVDAVRGSFQERTALLGEAVAALLAAGGLGEVVSVRKGRRAMADVLRCLVEVITAATAAVPTGTASGLNAKIRRAGCGSESSWSLLDVVIAEYLKAGREVVEGLTDATFALVASATSSTGATASIIRSLDRLSIGRFLMVHPRALGLLRALLSWTNEVEAVQGICDVAEEVHRRLPGGQEVDELWNLLIAVLSREGGPAAEIVNKRLGTFLANNLTGFA
jgi:hypothetical protein